MTVEDLNKLSFEEALTALEDIVHQLESGNVKLDAALSFYEKGVRLKQLCTQKLADAQLRIDKLIISDNGEITGKEPLDVDTL